MAVLILLSNLDLVFLNITYILALNQDPVEKYEHISTEEKVNIQTSMTSRMFKKSLLIDSKFLHIVEL